MRVAVQVYFDTDTGTLTFEVPAVDGVGDIVLYSQTSTIAAKDVQRVPKPVEQN